MNQNSIIINALFTYFKQHNNNEMVTTTNLISNIIKSRNEQNSQSKYNTIDQLPSNLIGHTASFLSIKSYINFEKCNRLIYIGCNSPNQLYSIPLSLMLKYPGTQSMKKYKFIKRLSLNINCFNNNLCSQNTSIWNTNNNIKTLIMSNDDGDENDLLTFINNKYITLNDIKRFKLYNFDELSILGSFPGFEFSSLLSSMRSVEYLDLEFIELTDYIFNDNDIKKWFTKLKGFSFQGNV